MRELRALGDKKWRTSSRRRTNQNT